MTAPPPTGPPGRGRVKLLIAASTLLVAGFPLLVPLLLVAFIAGGADGAAACPAGSTPAGTQAGQLSATSGDSWRSLNERQREIAGIVIKVGHALGVETNGLIAGLEAAAQESMFRVYANDGRGTDLEPDQYGIERSLAQPHDAVGTDHGSLGVFQQQWPWWGTLSELMDPQTSAQKFFRAMLDKVPNYPDLPAGDVAQRVQVSAYPDAYDDHEALARELLSHADQLGGTIRPINSAAPADAATASNLCGPGAAMDCPPTELPVEEGLTPDALRVLRCVDQQFGSHTYLGVGSRSNNSDSDHETGRAVDIMIERWSTATGRAEGWQIARWIRSHAAELGVSYIIFDARIWSTDRNSEDWRPYTHPSGADDATAAHRDHVHVSVYGNAAGQSELTGGWTNPLQPGTYTLTATFGACSALWTDCHTGTDLAAPEHTPIRAAHAGTVTTVGYDPDGYGNYLIITSGNTDIYYAHQCDGCIRVREDQPIAAGQQIGAVGSTGNTTGPHLHFEIRTNDQAIDPQPFMADRGVDL